MTNANKVQTCPGAPYKQRIRSFRGIGKPRRLFPKCPRTPRIQRYYNAQSRSTNARRKLFSTNDPIVRIYLVSVTIRYRPVVCTVIDNSQ